jgi:hypothetical protein
MLSAITTPEGAVSLDSRLVRKAVQIGLHHHRGKPITRPILILISRMLGTFPLSSTLEITQYLKELVVPSVGTQDCSVKLELEGSDTGERPKPQSYVISKAPAPDGFVLLHKKIFADIGAQRLPSNSEKPLLAVVPVLEDPDDDDEVSDLERLSLPVVYTPSFAKSRPVVLPVVPAIDEPAELPVAVVLPGTSTPSELSRGSDGGEAAVLGAKEVLPTACSFGARALGLQGPDAILLRILSTRRIWPTSELNALCAWLGVDPFAIFEGVNPVLQDFSMTPIFEKHGLIWVPIELHSHLNH